MTEDDFKVAEALNVSRETLGKLEQYADLVRKWNSAINLIGRSTEGQIWIRHIQDSAQLWGLRAAPFGTWLDLGSGGGLPGIVLATIATEKAPESRFVLVESDQRKATFLRTAARTLCLNVTVHAARVEQLPPQRADVISARALAPLTDLCALAAPHLAPEGMCLFPKGANYASEIAAARLSWNMEPEIHPSVTDPSAVILKLKAMAHV
ncbi:16S rRNA (guanine(527)-N(7))-methyltransferase RsmG [Cereibacter azotoformans]|uniref:16S rRNA (guanine(527)-N(7))-methyltransferase RsmG n=1 Tax=Cereibacter azotoformans TaxID=43057 RepID=UPI003B21AF79